MIPINLLSIVDHEVIRASKISYRGLDINGFVFLPLIGVINPVPLEQVNCLAPDQKNFIHEQENLANVLNIKILLLNNIAVVVMRNALPISVQGVFHFVFIVVLTYV